MIKLRLSQKLNGVLQFIIFGLTLVLSLSFGSCEKEHDTLVPPIFEEPPIPIINSVQTGDQTATLSWIIEDGSDQDVVDFRVYRREADSSAFLLRVSTAEQTYTDARLINGQLYFYAVASVTGDDLEGRKSESVAVTAHVFGFVINQNSEYTNDRMVTLQFSTTLDEGSGWVSLSNEPTFAQNLWQPYQLSLSWQLSDDDGPKSVFARFRDAQGNGSDTVVRTIILDRFSDILTIEFSPVGVPFFSGDTIHFQMETGESGGEAAVSVGSVIVDLILYDNGNHGDRLSEDGIYELDYIVLEGIEIENGIVVGSFIDLAGNSANPRTAPGSITIHRPPQPVTLIQPIPIEDPRTSLRLIWTPNTDEDFHAYQVYRRAVDPSGSPSSYKLHARQIAKVLLENRGSPSSDSLFEMIAIVREQSQLLYDDASLSENSTYQYRVDVVDMTALSAESNIVTGQTQADLAPTPTQIIVVPEPNTDNQLNISWIPNSDSDFYAYQLFRSDYADMQDSARVVELFDASVIQAVDVGLQSGSLYYYRMRTTDTANLSSVGDIASATTYPNLPPDSVWIETVNTVSESQLEIIWTPNQNSDFQRYNIYRDFTDEINEETSDFVTFITNIETTQYTNFNLQPNVEYFYRIYVRDSAGLTKGSNVKSGVTLPVSGPHPVELTDVLPVYNSYSSLQLIWTPNTEADFSSYRIYRSLELDFADSAFVDEVTNALVAIYVDGVGEETEPLLPATTYYYRVIVRNDAGLAAGSNIRSGTTNPDLPPLPSVVTVLPVSDTDDQLQISWTANNDPDFSAYQLYRSNHADFSDSLQLTLDDPAENFYINRGLDSGTAYYYRLRTLDMGQNDSWSQIASGMTHPNLPPQPVTILWVQPPGDNIFDALDFEWTPSSDIDFDRYEIYRGDHADFSDSTYLTGIGDQAEVTYSDHGLFPNRYYYYRVTTIDDHGAASHSNIRSGITGVDDPPTQVELLVVTPVTDNPEQLHLTWQANTDPDFSLYHIVRSLHENMADSTSVDFILTQSTFQYTDSVPDLMESTVYYYRVDVRDQGGQTTAGTVASGMTGLNQPPDPVTLSDPLNVMSTQADLNWGVSYATDFYYYNLYRDTTETVDLQSNRIAQLIGDPLATSYLDLGLAENTQYFYRVYVFDTRGASSGSNVVTTVTEDGMPTPVALLEVEPLPNTSDQLELLWRPNTDADFLIYQIRRARDVQMVQDSVTVALINTQSVNNYLDIGLSPNTIYFYRVDVHDLGGHISQSNVLSDTTGFNLPPTPVYIEEPFDLSSQSISLRWSPNSDADFLRYIVYRDLDSTVNDTVSMPVGFYEERLEVSHTDEGLAQNTTYFYRVYVEDQQGVIYGSNIVSATTLNDPPVPVVLNDPTSISHNGMTLTWGLSQDPDFESYRLYRSLIAGVDTTDHLRFSTTTQHRNFFDDSDLRDNTLYHYRIYLYDQTGESARSNEVQDQTLNHNPPSVTLESVTAISSTEIDLEWTLSSAHDFDEYQIFRDSQPSVTLESTPVATISDINFISYRDTDLIENSLYYYRIFVRDSGGLFTGSNVLSDVTGNDPPEPVVLSGSAQENMTVLLGWTQSTDPDFAYYRVFNSDTPGILPIGAAVITIPTASAISYIDRNVLPGQTLYYRIFVADSSGAVAGGNEIVVSIPAQTSSVALSGPFNVSQTSAGFSWTVNNDYDFDHYELHRDQSAGVNQDSPLVAQFDDPSQVNYTDSGLTAGNSYYYRLYCVGDQGSVGPSNSISVTTPTSGEDPGGDEIPTPVTILSINVPESSSDQLQLFWLTNYDENFSAYHIMRAENPSMTEELSIVTIISDRGTSQYIDTGLEPETGYYYRIDLYHTNGLSAIGNVVGNTTGMENVPEPVTLSDPFNVNSQSATLNWTVDNDSGFNRYALHRDDQSDVTLNSLQIALFTDPLQTTYTDQPLEQSRVYYYRVFVVHNSGAYSGSNVVSAETSDASPGIIELSDPSAIGETGMTLTWQAEIEPDFERYHLYRGTAPGIDMSDQLIATIDNSDQNYFDDAGLTDNSTYYYRVYLFDASNLYSRSNEASGTTLNAPPSAVQFTETLALSDSEIRLAWSASTAHDFAAYRVYRDLQPIVTLESDLIVRVTELQQIAYIDDQLSENTTYYYRIFTEDTGGLQTGSEVESATTLNTPPDPINLAVQIEEGSALRLTWDENQNPDFSAYQIYRSDQPGIGDNPTYDPLITLQSAATVTYLDTDVSSGEMWYYRVFATDDQGGRTGSAEVSALLPPTPVILSGQIVDNGVLLTWNQNSDSYFLNYRLYRSEEAGLFPTESLATIAFADSFIYQDNDVSSGDTWYYRLVVTDTNGQTSPSNTFTITIPLTQGVTLSGPYNITANSARFNWTVYDGDFQYYALYRDLTPVVTEESYQVAIYTSRLETEHTDETLTENTTYYFRVFVANNQGDAVGSNTVETPTEDGMPTAVQLVDVVAPAGFIHELQLYWLENQDADFEAYHIHRATNSAMTQNLTTVTMITAQNVTAYLDNYLIENTAYYYRIDVYDIAGHLTLGNVMGAVTGENNSSPDPVELSDPTDVTSGSISLHWTANLDSDFDRYIIYRDQDPDVNEIASLAIADIDNRWITSYTDQELSENRQFYYRVYVVDSQGTRAGSNVVAATTLNNPPTTPTLNSPSAIGDDGMTLTWLVNNDADFEEYRLYRSLTAGVDVMDSLVATLDEATLNYYDDTGLTDNTRYHYRLYVYDSAGEFSRSAEVSEITLNHVPPATDLVSVNAISASEMRLYWNQSSAHDFAAYLVYRDQTDVNLQSEQIAQLTDVADTTYLDTGLTENTVYNYRIFTEDSGGLISGGNTMSDTTENAAPTPSELTADSGVGSVTLSWSINSDEDFAQYRLYRSTTPSVDDSGSAIAVMDSPSSVSYFDSDVQTGQVWYYRIFTVDNDGLTSGGNEVAVVVE
ncbi:MAG: hypothetical protein B6244_00180 [Candidatus Cloacimonetes bacterium 4572_55]|nr:MAG: hypothetical protein B6244_00180 [Candidatus Cloacimonetes bacterium 4572_55]